VRLFAFGVGDDVNTILLDTLAQEQRGASGYVRPGERIDEEVSAFYTKVSTPLLADITVEVEGVLVEEMYPYPLPDLFAGTQLVIVGRYREGGAALIRLRGQVNEQEQQFSYEGFFQSSGGERFIPRLWATRKIGYLLNQIRLRGENREWVDTIVELSIRYGIVTPYTSYLVQEDADILTREGRENIVVEEVEMLAAAPTMVTGAQAVEKAVGQEAMRGADMAAAPVGEAAEVVKIIGDKTFVYRDAIWTDTAFDPSQVATQKVGFGSETYFELLSARPDLGTYFSLGDRVIVVVDGVAYEVAESGASAIDLPPTATPQPVEANPTHTATPAVRATEDASRSSGSSSLCPGTLLAGLMLVPFAGAGLYRSRRR
jgi:Ca-activated chloride channel family protein